MLQHTTIEVFDTAIYVLYSLFDIVLVIMMEQYDTFLILTLIKIWCSIIFGIQDNYKRYQFATASNNVQLIILQQQRLYQ